VGGGEKKVEYRGEVHLYWKWTSKEELELKGGETAGIYTAKSEEGRKKKDGK